MAILERDLIQQVEQDLIQQAELGLIPLVEQDLIRPGQDLLVILLEHVHLVTHQDHVHLQVRPGQDLVRVVVDLDLVDLVVLQDRVHHLEVVEAQEVVLVVADVADRNTQALKISINIL